MHILVLSTCYPQKANRAHGIFAHRLNLAMTELGAECHVLQPTEWAPPPPFDRIRSAWRDARLRSRDLLTELDGITIEHPRVYKPVPSRFFPRDYWTVTGHAVASWIRGRPALMKADVILAHFLCHEAFAGLIAGRQLGIPVVGFALGDDVHGWPERWPDRRHKLAKVLAGADGLLANSRALAEDARRWATPAAHPHIEVVYHGVEHAQFSPAESPEVRALARRSFGLPPLRRLLLCVGWPSAAKGWLDLFDAVHALGDSIRDWDIAMATAPYVSETRLDLAAEAAARGLRNRVISVGTVAPVMMPSLYRAADAFALPSHNEGLSNAVLEALASGLPVVTTTVGGHPEVIRDGVDGRLVPPGDPRALAAALREVMTDVQSARRMGASARRRAVALGDFRTNAARLLAYLESVVAAQRPAVAPRAPIGVA